MMNKETIKVFLKPNRRKILVFLAIPVTLELLGFFIGSTIDRSCGGIIALTFFICLILAVFINFPLHFFPISYDSHNSEGILSWVLLIFYWYFLSCIINMNRKKGFVLLFVGIGVIAGIMGYSLSTNLGYMIIGIGILFLIAGVFFALKYRK